MGKKALVAKSDDVQFLFDKPWQEPHLRTTYLNDEKAKALFQTVNTHLGDRDVIEDDPSLQQFLPYNALIEIQDDFSAHIFMYRRGKGSDEAGLHDLYSVGLGGHVDEVVRLDGADADSILLEETLVQSTIRELQEEVGFTPNEYNVREQLRRAFVVSDTRTKVEKVHMGLIFPVFGKKSQLGVHEVNVIDEGQWIPLEELHAKHAAGQIKLEPWSILTVENLIHTFRPINTTPPETLHITTTGFLQVDTEATSA